jgi:membrane-associated phospholipid phosphatase
MRMPMPLVWSLALLVLAAAAGCSSTHATSRQADLTYQRLTAPAADPQMALGRALPDTREPAAGRAPVLFFAPRAEPSPLDSPPFEVAAARAGGAAAALSAPAKPSAEQKAVKAGEFPAFPEGSFWEVVKSDVRAVPGKLWDGAKYSFGNVGNIVILSATFGVDRIVRNNVDDRVRHDVRNEDAKWIVSGDFGEVLGHPGLHFGLAGAWYLVSVAYRDEKNHEFSKVLIEALAVNGITTGVLQAAVNQRDPSGDKYGWPSGHTSSSFTVASVLHEYYGWQVGVPAYMVAGYLAATRVGERRHNVSDLIFGAGLGIVIGHSVARGELPQLGGFAVLPYAGEDADTLGVMLMKQW